MSFKMLIVDDEPVICSGLRQTIPWETLGIDVVGEAYDGEEALRIAAEQPLDLVLTDISMEGMDGLQLAGALKRHSPHLRVILISGYEQFEYARQAVRLGIEDYLLKPVDIDELIRLVTKISDQLAAEEMQKLQAEREEWLNWLSGQMQGSEQASPQGSLPWGIEKPAECRVVVSQLDHYSYWRNRLSELESRQMRKSWRTAVEAILQAGGWRPLSFFHHPNLLVTLSAGFPMSAGSFASKGSSLTAGSPLIELQPLEGLLCEAAERWEGPSRLAFGVSSAFAEPAYFRQHGMEAVQALQRRAIEADRIVFVYDCGMRMTSRKVSPSTDETCQWEERIVRSILMEEEQALAATVRDLLNRCRDRGMLLDEAVQVCDELRLMVCRKLRESGLRIGREAAGYLMAKLDPHVYNCYASVEAFFIDQLLALVSAAVPPSSGKAWRIMEQAKSYIIQNSGSDLRATDVAGWLQITPNYFSMLFKQHTGKNFSEFLNEQRIRRAKELLLESTDRVYEIADQVGYKEYKYFSAIFKAHTGLTPTDYRELASAR
ncbi:response regulator [Paenibacillus sp. J2TS4]|uniref:response regulator transcription factor n=1 Tax=Paenibacillus sp. J2TS4 TaxID=2807194 RepID=UPI001B2C745D|nr:response regulator [Paenibacillus sp. J2TS4]GIP32835.1 AraC family transcriptional regulator [Paenibacillus sp. J2TS4]